MTLPQKLTPRHFLLLLAITLLLLLLLIVSRPQRSAAMRAPIIPTVMVTPVLQGDLSPSLRLSGRLQPRLAAVLNAEVAGRVVERNAEPGQSVEQGELLLRLDEGDYRDALLRAEAQLAQEQAALERDRRLLELARENRKLQAREVKRLQRLGSESLSSASRRDEAHQRLLQLQAEEARLDYAVSTAAARLSLRQAELDRAERDLARSAISAPFAGTVNELLVDVGDHVAKNQQVASLIALDELDFYAELPGNTPTALSLGQSIAIEVDGVSHQGTVRSLQRAPDRTTHTLAMRIRVAGEGLMPGAIAETQLPLRTLHDVLQVPVASLLREDGRAYLFVEREGRLSRREVEPLQRSGGKVVIRGGVEPGERIVARDVAALSDGQQVKALSN